MEAREAEHVTETYRQSSAALVKAPMGNVVGRRSAVLITLVVPIVARRDGVSEELGQRPPQDEGRSLHRLRLLALSHHLRTGGAVPSEADGKIPSNSARASAPTTVGGPGE